MGGVANRKASIRSGLFLCLDKMHMGKYERLLLAQSRH